MFALNYLLRTSATPKNTQKQKNTRISWSDLTPGNTHTHTHEQLLNSYLKDVRLLVNVGPQVCCPCGSGIKDSSGGLESPALLKLLSVSLLLSSSFFPRTDRDTPASRLRETASWMVSAVLFSLTQLFMIMTDYNPSGDVPDPPGDVPDPAALS